MADAPDLGEAIKAGVFALMHKPFNLHPDGGRPMARAVLEAAAPVLLQATRDRLADLEMYAAELHDLLTRTTRIRAAGQEGRCTFCHQFPDHAHCWWCGIHEPSHLSDCPVAHALQADPPARGRAILEEVERLRAFVRDIRGAMTPEAVAAAYAALDLGAAQEEGSGG